MHVWNHATHRQRKLHVVDTVLNNANRHVKVNVPVTVEEHVLSVVVLVTVKVGAPEDVICGVVVIVPDHVACSVGVDVVVNVVLTAHLQQQQLDHVPPIVQAGVRPAVIRHVIVHVNRSVFPAVVQDVPVAETLAPMAV